MKFTIKLPTNLKKMTVGELLTTEWLVPKKQRHFLRTKQHILINGDIAKFSDLVRGGGQNTVIFDVADFPEPVFIKPCEFPLRRMVWTPLPKVEYELSTAQVTAWSSSLSD